MTQLTTAAQQLSQHQALYNSDAVLLQLASPENVEKQHRALEGVVVVPSKVHVPSVVLVLRAVISVGGDTVVIVAAITEGSLLLFCLLFGVIGSKITNRLIVSFSSERIMVTLQTPGCSHVQG